MNTRAFFVAVCLLGVCGCAALNLSHKATYKNHQQALQNNNVPFSDLPVLMLADNQKAQIYTEPVFEQSAFSETIANTAHRLPALDAFSLDIVEHISESEDYQLIIHGGDLLNNSCVSEFKLAVNAINSSKKSDWFMAPGNHDGYYLGISSPRAISKGFPAVNNFLLDERAGWGLTCTQLNKKRIDVLEEKYNNSTANRITGGGYDELDDYTSVHDNIADKAVFNWLYLKEIGIDQYIKKHQVQTFVKSLNGDFSEYNLHCLAFDDENLHRKFMSNVCWTQYKEYKDYFARQPNAFNYGCDGNNPYECQFEEKTPWRNFIIQKLTVQFNDKTTSIIIVDTSAYSKGRGINEHGEMADIFAFGAADAAEIVPPQRAVFDSWLSRSQPTILVGHHPLFDLDVDSYSLIDKAFSNGNVWRYVSGDTHNGYDAKLRFPSEGLTASVHEINLGSTIDAPIEYALLGMGTAPGHGDFDQQLISKRFSLTPLMLSRKEKRKHGRFTITVDNKNAYKVDANIEEPKYYAEFNDDLWRKCNEQWPYHNNAKSFDPLSILSDLERADINDMDISQPSSYLGLPYALAIFNSHTMRNIRHDSLRAYKINRLWHLANVYEQLFNYAQVLPSNVLLNKKEVALKQLADLKAANFMAYLSVEDNFLKTINRLVELLQQYNDEIPTNPPAQLFKQCSALYDAEREYRW